MSARGGRVLRNVMSNVREYILSFVLSVIPNKSTNHDELEQLMLKRSKITEIDGLFNINEVEYRELITLFIESDRYINEIQSILSFNRLISAQDVIKKPL